MNRPVASVVLGGGIDGLAAAIALARAGDRVVLLESADRCGGVHRPLQVAPGHAAPLSDDAGWMPLEVSRGLGLVPPPAGEARAVLAAAGDGWLRFTPDPGETAASIGRHSPEDAGRWPDFSRRIHRLSKALASLYVAPPPRVDAERMGEMLGLLRVGRTVRGLGRADMVEFLRTVPMAVAEMLDEWFAGEGLKGALAGDALTDLCQGPMSGGTAFNLLHRHAGAPAGAVRSRSGISASALMETMLARAAAVGVEIRTGARVAEVLVRNELTTGVRLEGGEEIACHDVVSALDPWESLLGLVDPVHLDPEFIRAVGNIRFRGAASFVMLVLDGLPQMPEGFDGVLSVAPSVRDLERAFDSTKYGEISGTPALTLTTVSSSAGGQSPDGRSVAVVRAQFTPYRLRGGSWDDARRGALGDRVVAMLDERLPGFAARVQERRVLSPADVEAELGCREGALAAGEMMLDQILFMRPVAGCAHSATPIGGYYLAGPGAHPGPGVAGASGWLAAQAVLRGRGG